MAIECAACRELAAQAAADNKLGYVRCGACLAAAIAAPPGLTIAVLKTITPPVRPSDWYDGNPKPCPGGLLCPATRFTGEMLGQSCRVSRSACPWCDVEYPAGEPMPEHTFIPVRPDEAFVFTQGKMFYGMESEDGEIRPPWWPRPSYPIDRSHVTDSRNYLREVLGEWGPKPDKERP